MAGSEHVTFRFYGGFKTVNGKETCATLRRGQTGSVLLLYACFKTVNGKETCATGALGDRNLTRRKSGFGKMFFEATIFAVVSKIHRHL